MAKDENVMQTLLKLNRRGNSTDTLLFDVLSKCDNKTDLIKNALFNYIINIQNGTIIDRSYPYNEVEKYTEIGKERVVYSYNSSYNSSYGKGNFESNSDNVYDDEQYSNNYDDEEQYSDNYDDEEYEEYEEYEEEEENEYEDGNVSLF